MYEVPLVTPSFLFSAYPQRQVLRLELTRIAKVVLDTSSRFWLRGRGCRALWCWWGWRGARRLRGTVQGRCPRLRLWYRYRCPGGGDRAGWGRSLRACRRRAWRCRSGACWWLNIRYLASPGSASARRRFWWTQSLLLGSAFVRQRRSWAGPAVQSPTWRVDDAASTAAFQLSSCPLSLKQLYCLRIQGSTRACNRPELSKKSLLWVFQFLFQKDHEQIWEVDWQHRVDRARAWATWDSPATRWWLRRARSRGALPESGTWRRQTESSDMWLLSKPSVDFPFSGRAGRWLSVASW